MIALLDNYGCNTYMSLLWTSGLPADTLQGHRERFHDQFHRYVNHNLELFVNENQRGEKHFLPNEVCNKILAHCSAFKLMQISASYPPPLNSFQFMYLSRTPPCPSSELEKLFFSLPEGYICMYYIMLYFIFCFFSHGDKTLIYSITRNHNIKRN